MKAIRGLTKHGVAHGVGGGRMYPPTHLGIKKKLYLLRFKKAFYMQVESFIFSTARVQRQER